MKFFYLFIYMLPMLCSAGANFDLLKSERLNDLSRDVPEGDEFVFMDAWLEIVQAHSDFLSGHLEYSSEFWSVVAGRTPSEIIAMKGNYSQRNAMTVFAVFEKRIATLDSSRGRAADPYYTIHGSNGSEVSQSIESLMNSLSSDYRQPFIRAINSIRYITPSQFYQDPEKRDDFFIEMPPELVDLFADRTYAEVLEFGEISGAIERRMRDLEFEKVKVSFTFSKNLIKRRAIEKRDSEPAP